MDVYVSQLTGTDYHDYFYTHPQVIVSTLSMHRIQELIEGIQAAYKNYVSVFVGRYVNEPGILAWELANEPRCAGSTG